MNCSLASWLSTPVTLLNRLVVPDSIPERLSAFAALMMGCSWVANEASAGSAFRSLFRLLRSFCASVNSTGDVAVWSDARVFPRSVSTDESWELFAEPAAMAACETATVCAERTSKSTSAVVVTGAEDGPKLAVIVVARVWFSVADASGVSVSVSVWLAPAAIVTGARLPAVSPVGVVAESVTVSETLPTFWSVSVAVAGVPGVLLSDVGELVSETASMSGTVNVSVWLWMIEESVVLVAVTVNESCVPGGGIGWPVFGTT